MQQFFLSLNLSQYLVVKANNRKNVYKLKQNDFMNLINYWENLLDKYF